MLTFSQFLKEDTNVSTNQQNVEPGFTGGNEPVDHFLSHLMSPSDPTGHKSGVNESLEEDVKRIEIHHGKDLPKTNAMIAKGNTLIPHDANIHKRIHEGFKKTFSDMGHETPEENKAKLKESHKVLEHFSKTYGYKHRPELLVENGKTKKSTGVMVHTKGLALAPHTTNGLKGFDVCPRASSECRANCIGTEVGGNKQYPDSSLSSKVVRTHFLALHPEHAARIIDHEIGQHVKKATKAGYKPGVRLNATSDINWEHHAPEIFHRHPDADFYDYTKLHHRLENKNLPSNYHLALSHTGADHAESNDKHVAHALKNGKVVAMVYAHGKHEPKPTHVVDVKGGHRYPIVNGDFDDHIPDRHAQAGLTPNHPGHGVVSGLKLKGVSAASAGKFANKVEKNGEIHINKN